MENHEVQTSPQVYARIGGVLYLIMIVVGIFDEAFNGFWSSPSNREKENAYQTNALSPPIEYC